MKIKKQYSNMSPAPQSDVAGKQCDQQDGRGACGAGSIHSLQGSARRCAVKGQRRSAGARSGHGHTCGGEGGGAGAGPRAVVQEGEPGADPYAGKASADGPHCIGSCAWMLECVDARMRGWALRIATTAQ